ncbi:probable phospholipid-transporting ATPase VA isoform X2 [Nasonia vitripennis]|uniref:Phospholipid-transporting ATPase n=1 Tax=Nasonia vitripennis TaxID=7425 RepID=A0A7M7G8T2_NASVI|nr:probable phospholipid-transporting ATPase VA isoform X2 [Nasonia vitripennis]
MSESCVQEEACEEAEKEKRSALYVFPSIVPAAVPLVAGTSQQQLEMKRDAVIQPQPLAIEALDSQAIDSIAQAPQSMTQQQQQQQRVGLETPISRIMSSRTHARSASHGGMLASSGGGGTPSRPGNSNWMGAPGPTPRPSALKKPGHQRAFSQGQVVEVQRGQPVSGHSRVGSKTDFILPPGHREEGQSSGGATAGGGAAKAPSFRGHSRQASRSESIYTIRRSAAPPWWRRAWARCFGSLPEEPPLRTIVPNHLLPPDAPQTKQIHASSVDNRVRTTKYTTLSFLPRNLLEQFHRVANLYFIFIVLLNWVPAINAFGKEVAMIPVVFVLGVTALKDFFEDRRRLASDRRVNNFTCRVYARDGDRYVKTAWKDIKVGDLVHLSNNELVPADVLLLRSSDPQGFAYLDTCNLDGETNLKQRQVVKGFLDIQSSFQPAKFRSIIEVDKPSTKIYRFHGAVVHPNGARVPVSTENLLLRECLLKNTDFVEGIVVYVGHETKAMLNNGGPRYKRSRLERQMNLDVVWCVVILVVLCIVGAAGCRFWLSAYTSVGPVLFLPVIQDPSYEGMLTFWTFVIILQVMIPLSLYVTIEMAKLGQVYHISCDSELYDPETDRTAECRALNITEELGQVQYVFSDKTGTLTENKMIFRRCAVGGQDYAHTGEGENLVPCIRLKEDLLIGTCRHRLQEFLILLAICNTVVVNTHPHHDNMNSSGVIEEPQNNGAADPTRYVRLTESRSVTPAPPETTSPALPHSSTITPPNSEEIFSSVASMEITESDESSVLRSKISRPKLLNLPTMTNLSMLTKRLSPLGMRNNSSSVPERNGRSLLETPSTPAIYEAESPDELALVHAARAYNVRLTRRTAQSAIVSLPDKSSLAFEILKTLPFDSNRKCMSIVVRHPHTDEIVLYCKGADSAILSALNANEEDSTITTKVRQQLHSYARQGLRTLVMARRSLTAQEFELWTQKHAEIEACHENRERRLRESYTSLESHLTLLGATGIEDKLQAGVPEAMASLVSAGIVVWVLTGDKPETAVNIAYSACLFTPAMQLLRLQARSKSVAESLIHGHLEAIQRENAANAAAAAGESIPHELDPAERLAYRIGSPWQRQRALVVDGKTLTFILDPRSGLTGPFLDLTRACSSVLACRATPLQKAYIVRVVKEQLRMRTLAIGDGANDVSMIQTADVGIGVSGREGTQAVMAADFSIARFPMLTRLLFVHGHWCYDRLSRMILYFFYKNATFVFLIFWYQLYCGFSGTVMIDQIYLMLYNLIFTSLPPLILGVYDQMAPASLLMELPRLYERGRLASVYQPHSFWVTMADALYQSIIIFFLTEAIYHDSDVDIWEFGTTITSICIVVMLLHISVETRSWTLMHVAGMVCSVGAFFGFALIYNAVCVNCMGLLCSYWVMEVAIGRYIFWLTIIITSVLAILPRLIYRVVKSTIAPDIIQRANVAYMEKNGRFTNRRGVGSGESGLVAGWSRSTQNATIRAGSYTSKNNVLTTVVA